MPATSVRLTGTIDREHRALLDVTVDSDDLANADTLFTRLRQALGASAPVPAGLGGRGRLTGQGAVRDLLER